MANTNTIHTGMINLPPDVASGIFKKAMENSALARLAGAEPQKFGKVTHMVLTASPKAELVGEGAEKSPTPMDFSTKTVVPHKLHVTVRVSNEVQWQDEDYQTEVLDTIADEASIALGRALDIIGINGLNPLTGQPASSVTEKIADTTNVFVPSNGAYDEAIEQAVAAILSDGYMTTGVAFDPALSTAIAAQRDKQGRKLYPELGFGTRIDSYQGLDAAVSDSVSAKREAAAATDILGVVGDFDAFKWGIQRDIAAEVITYGDPDGLGDLRRNNQIAIRAEIVYGIAIMDPEAFALIKSK